MLTDAAPERLLSSLSPGGSDLQTGHGCVMQRLLEEWIRYTQRQWVMIKIAEPLGRGI